MPLRLKRFPFTIFTDKSGVDASRVPVNGAFVDVYRQGATAETGATISQSGGTGTFTVRDLGRVRDGDVIFRISPSPNTGAKLTITSISGAGDRDLNVRNDEGSDITVSIGDRFTVLSPRPDIYSENTGASTPLASSRATSDAKGEGQFFADEQAVDRLVSGGAPVITAFGKFDDGGEAGATKHVSNEPESSVVTSIAHIFDTVDTFVTAGGLLLRILMGGVEKWKLDKDGAVTQQGGHTIASGGVTITLGGLTVSAGGITVTGNSIFNDNLTVTDQFDVTIGPVNLAGIVTSVGLLILQDRLRFVEIATPATPAADRVEIYADTADDRLKSIRSDGISRALENEANVQTATGVTITNGFSTTYTPVVNLDIASFAASNPTNKVLMMFDLVISDPDVAGRLYSFRIFNASDTVVVQEWVDLVVAPTTSAGVQSAGNVSVHTIAVDLPDTAKNYRVEVKVNVGTGDVVASRHTFSMIDLGS